MLSEKTIERVILFSALPMLAGVACWFAGLAITGVMLVGLGAMGGSFTEYRREHGIWMLGALFLGIFAIFYAAYVYFSVVDGFAGRGPFGIVAVDAFLATSTLGFMVRFLWSVTLLNRQFVPSPKTKHQNDG
jgi:hypothetical protein